MEIRQLLPSIQVGYNMKFIRTQNHQDISFIVLSCASFGSNDIYHRIEMGKKQINLHQLVEICNLWNISVDELLFGNTAIR
jgi:hypothetical protein